jgi:hypothetical protein
MKFHIMQTTVLQRQNHQPVNAAIQQNLQQERIWFESNCLIAPSFENVNRNKVRSEHDTVNSSKRLLNKSEGFRSRISLDNIQWGSTQDGNNIFGNSYSNKHNAAPREIVVMPRHSMSLCSFAQKMERVVSEPSKSTNCRDTGVIACVRKWILQGQPYMNRRTIPLHLETPSIVSIFPLCARKLVNCERFSFVLSSEGKHGGMYFFSAMWIIQESESLTRWQTGILDSGLGSSGDGD